MRERSGSIALSCSDMVSSKDQCIDEAKDRGIHGQSHREHHYSRDRKQRASADAAPEVAKVLKHDYPAANIL